MINRLVSLVKGKGRKGNIKKSLELIESDLGALKDAKKILIKPNLTALHQDYANTNIDAVEAVIEFLRERTNAEITVGESSATAFYRGLPTTKVFEMQDYYTIKEKYPNVSLTDFDNDDKFIKIPIKSVVGDSYLRLSERIKEFDYKISLSIPKTHNYAMMTGGIKNMAGFIRREDMARIHGMKGGIEIDAPKTLLDKLPKGTVSWARRNASWLVNSFFSIYPTYRKSVKMIHHNVTNIAKETWPELVVLDGYLCMEGDGPIDGETVKLDMAISSADPLKADGLAARIMGFNPEDVGYLYYLNREGMGNYSTAGLIGNKIDEVKRNFKRHRTYNIQKNWKEE